MKNYVSPSLHTVCADTALSATLWDEMSFNKLDGLNANDSAGTSVVNVNIPDNPEGDI